MNVISSLKRLYERLYTRLWRIKIEKAKAMPLRNVILFESVPDFSDNTKAVFDEMIKRNLNSKYKLIWISRSPNIATVQNIKNVYYYAQWSFQAKYYSEIAKVKICCNDFLKKNRNDQFSIYLSHGTTIKRLRSYYTVPDGIDYVLAASQNVVDFQSYELNFKKECIIPLGFPRNDVFSQGEVDIKSILETNCNKIIVWYPTYRQRKNNFKTNSSNSLPIIHNSEFANTINDIAKKLSILIVVKPHFAQDLSYIKELNLSNIKFIDDTLFKKHNITSYQFVSACDALITDYSSIYYDYLLCNQPVAAIWEDIEEYKQFPGLIDNYEYLMKGAEKIYNVDDFRGFINRIGNDIDMLKSEREEIRDYTNYSTDGRNSERVVDFIIEKANL